MAVSISLWFIGMGPRMGPPAVPLLSGQLRRELRFVSDLLPWRQGPLGIKPLKGPHMSASMVRMR